MASLRPFRSGLIAAIALTATTGSITAAAATSASARHHAVCPPKLGKPGKADAPPIRPCLGCAAVPILA